MSNIPPDSITQAEFEKQFQEYLKQQTPPADDGLPQWRERWVVGHRFAFDKKLQKEGLAVRPGFCVDNLGKVIYEDHS